MVGEKKKKHIKRNILPMQTKSEDTLKFLRKIWEP